MEQMALHPGLLGALPPRGCTFPWGGLTPTAATLRREPPSGLPSPWPACLGESEVGARAERERGDGVALPRGQGRQRSGRVHDDAGAPLTTSTPAGKAVATWRDFGGDGLGVASSPWRLPSRPLGSAGTRPLRHSGWDLPQALLLGRQTPAPGKDLQVEGSQVAKGPSLKHRMTAGPNRGPG